MFNIFNLIIDLFDYFLRFLMVLLDDLVFVIRLDLDCLERSRVIIVFLR